MLRVPHISDALWDRVRPIVAGSDPEAAVAPDACRLLVDAVIYWAITGADWTELPSELPHDAWACQTYQRWKERGILTRLSAALLVNVEDEGLACGGRWR